jgi:hypothetical protein
MPVAVMTKGAGTRFPTGAARPLLESRSQVLLLHLLLMMMPPTTMMTETWTTCGVRVLPLRLAASRTLPPGNPEQYQCFTVATLGTAQRTCTREGEEARRQATRVGG